MSIFKDELKKLIIAECEKEGFCPEDIEDDAPLFGPESALGLDSLDALQISMALQEKYGMKITDSKKLRHIMFNINSLAKYIHEQ